MIERPSLRARIVSGETIIGTFVKTPAPQIVENLGYAGVDFVAIDAEHAPFGLAELDAMAIAARASDVAMMVRVPSHDPAFIGSCLDLGATGIIVPHVRTAAEAQAVADAMRYRGGRRSFSPSTRAADYGARRTGHIARSDDAVTLWCQIEDADALDHLDTIAAVEGVDCLFLGPADLALSLGLSLEAPADLQTPISRLLAACRSSGRATGIFVPEIAFVRDRVATGFTVIACSSDQSMIMSFGRSLAGLASILGGTNTPRKIE